MLITQSVACLDDGQLHNAKEVQVEGAGAKSHTSSFLSDSMSLILFFIFLISSRICRSEKCVSYMMMIRLHSLMTCSISGESMTHDGSADRLVILPDAGFNI